MPTPKPLPLRRLVLVFGDQLDAGSAALADFDPARDQVWMAEVAEEIESPAAHKIRIAVFLAAMRHFRDTLRARGWTVHYRELPGPADADTARSFPEVLSRSLAGLRPASVRMARPGDWRVREAITRTVREAGLPLEEVEESHFLCSVPDFERFAGGRRRTILEDFQRWMRRREGVLVDGDGAPEGGAWNFDAANRKPFGKAGPGAVPSPVRFAPDAVTREVIALVNTRYAAHPGDLRDFSLPVTPTQAHAALQDFLQHRLPRFGEHQDAMWSSEPFLFHSRLSVPLNLKLLDPREAIAGAVDAYRAGHAPLASVEGFVRQILGWREFVRGIYWTRMPDYAGLNALGATGELPSFFWDGRTDMECVRQAMRNVLDHAYAHHIQRLMVLGLYALLAGVHPYRFHEWHMAMYADAVDWVSLPNTLGMSQHGDGGIVGTKPYCASGAYIKRMSNHCASCRFKPDRATGPEACPFTTLYWDFLDRHRARFAANGRMDFQMKNLARKAERDLVEIRKAAERLRGIR